MKQSIALAAALGVGLGACGSVDTAGQQDAGVVQSGPTFYEDVAPILAAHCTGCHQPGGIAPFSLIEYDDALGAAPVLGATVAARIMPPFSADNSGDCNTYDAARWLDDDEIDVLVAWADGDRAEGDSSLAPPPPVEQPGLARVDATLDMGVEYVADDALDDEYRCFIVDPELSADKFLTALEVVPGNEQVVHHVLLFSLDSEEAEAAAAQLDADADGPGYQCFGGAGVAQSTLLGVWAPGVRVSRYPATTGLPVKAGRKMIMQIHYNLLGGPMADRTRIDLELADTVDNPAFLAMVADLDLSLPPNQENVSTSGTLQVPFFVGNLQVWGHFPHMHTLGRSLRVDLVHDGDQSCMVDVPRWDFEWQQFFFYEDPILVAGQDDVNITCTFDTRGRDTTTTWGEGTLDEMCLAFLYVTEY